VVKTLAGSGTAGVADGVGDKAQFVAPAGLAFIGGKLYVADFEGHNIRCVDPATGAVTTIAGSAGKAKSFKNATGAEALFDSPQGLGVSLKGDLLVADFFNNRIRQVDLHDGKFTVSTVLGSGEKKDAAGSATTGAISQPKYVVVDGLGNLIVSSEKNVFFLRCQRRQAAHRVQDRHDLSSGLRSDVLYTQ